jgi:hypothetical protein
MRRTIALASAPSGVGQARLTLDASALSQNAAMNNLGHLRRRAVIASSVLLVSSFAGSVATAQTGTLNCNRDFAQIGDSKFVILQKCGEPVFKDAFCKKPDPTSQPFIAEAPRGQRNIIINGNACDQVEEWTYKPGSGQFITLLLFQDGVLKNIRYAGRIP